MEHCWMEAFWNTLLPWMHAKLPTLTKIFIKILQKQGLFKKIFKFWTTLKSCTASKSQLVEYRHVCEWIGDASGCWRAAALLNKIGWRQTCSHLRRSHAVVKFGIGTATHTHTHICLTQIHCERYTAIYLHSFISPAIHSMPNKLLMAFRNCCALANGPLRPASDQYCNVQPANCWLLHCVGMSVSFSRDVVAVVLKMSGAYLNMSNPGKKLLACSLAVAISAKYNNATKRNSKHL